MLQNVNTFWLAAHINIPSSDLVTELQTLFDVRSQKVVL